MVRETIASHWVFHQLPWFEHCITPVSAHELCYRSSYRQLDRVNTSPKMQQNSSDVKIQWCMVVDYFALDHYSKKLVSLSQTAMISMLTNFCWREAVMPAQAQLEWEDGQDFKHLIFRFPFTKPHIVGFWICYLGQVWACILLGLVIHQFGLFTNFY